MTRGAPPRYPGRTMKAFLRWAAAATLAAALSVAASAHARADDIAVGASPVVSVQLQYGYLRIVTWNRPDVEIESAGHIGWQHFDAASVRGHIPHDITLWAQRVTTPRGSFDLPAEQFVLPTLPPGNHEAVVIRGGGATVIHLPASTQMLAVRIAGSGVLRIEGYHGAAFAALVHQGAIALENVRSSGVAQVGRGPIFAENSSFGRLRARNAVGNIFFSNVTATQIDVGTVGGSIVAENMHFRTGLARFQSQRGNVVLGVSGRAQIDAQGRGANAVATSFRGAHTVSRSRSGARAILGGGGPIVTALSPRGRVVLFDGSIASHPRLSRRVPEIARAFHQVRARMAKLPKRSPQGGHVRAFRRFPPPRRPTPRRPIRVRVRRHGPPAL
uniref:Uncharacterized protein n=1 Tax=mine drainage metagenome TaxID=410659 RepID=E6Q3G3_9ZZZZ